MDPSNFLLIGLVTLIVILLVAKRLRQAPAAKVRELLARNALVIDVRSSDEFARDHVKGALNLPLEQVQRRIGSIEPNHQRPILVHCLSGTRSARAEVISALIHFASASTASRGGSNTSSS